jgi:thioredoxin-like negative regulator of GroEL
VGAAVIGWLIVALVRRNLAARRRQALAAPPLTHLGGNPSAEQTSAPIRILAFSTVQCTQCHTLQAPALERVRAARLGMVEVVEIDAIASPELADRYRIMTVPSTVVLDARGRAVAVNYGYADTRTLLQQVDDVLASQASTASPIAG